MKHSHNNAKIGKSKRKLVRLSIVILLFVGLAIICLPYIGKEKTADDEIANISSRLRVGINRNELATILESNGFKLNTKSPPKNNLQNRQIYVKGAGKMTFSWIRYDVFIEYNENGLMKFARFLKSRHSDGQDISCIIIFEIPTEKNKRYPIACPMNVQDF